MKKVCNITCRYGISYPIELNGSRGAIARTAEMLRKCCCWVCHNNECREPRNEVIPDCGEVCELFTDKHYCKR